MRRCICISAFLTSFLCFSAWAASPDAPGVPNFHQVNEHVYRGGQPSSKAWSGLAQLGIKTVIDLRREGEHPVNLEERAVEAAGMRYVNIPMNGIVAPSNDDVAKALALLESADGGSVFVHCRRGADRTGTVIACYRMAHDHWDNEKALKEAKSYGMSWIQVGMKHYVMNFQAPVVQAASTPNLKVVPAVAAP